MVVDLTEKEVMVALQLFDLATRSGGLQVAREALVLVDKLHAVAQLAKSAGVAVDAVDVDRGSDR